MKWVDDQIAKWVKWQTLIERHKDATLIPEDVQVGKILEHYNRSIDSALAFCDGQMSQDMMMSRSMNDGYWPRVHKILMEYKTSTIIEGSYDDTHSDRVLGKPWFG